MTIVLADGRKILLAEYANYVLNRTSGETVTRGVT
jgi:hypothetical protein